MSRKYGAAPFHVGIRALILYLIVATFFLATVMVNQRNHNDAWILDGVLIPTLMFVFFFCLVETFAKGNGKIAILTASFLVVVNLVAGLKYQLFYNTYDSSFHFGFTQELTQMGYVIETPDTDPQTYYSRNPGMHIFMGSLSVVSGIPINEIFRFVMPALYGLVPIIVFFVTNGVVADNIQKYCIVASAFPITQGYIITGTGLTILVYFLFFAVFLRRVFSTKKKREYTTVFFILGFALIISHAVTPLVVAFLLIGLPLGLRILHAISAKGFPKSPASTYVSSALIYLVMLMAWWANMATVNLDFFVFYIKKVLSPTGFMELPVVPTRFYEVPLWAQIRVFFVFNILYAIVGALSLIGLLVFLRRLRQEKLDNKTKGLYTHLLVLSGIIAVYQLFTIGYGSAMLAYQRFMVYLILFGFFFAGLALWRFNIFLSNSFSRFNVRKLAFASLLFILMSCCLIQFFRCQPLIPRASVLATDLPENEYLVDIHLANTVYQKEMISFAETHFLEGRVASDIATGWQIEAFSNRSFQSRLIWGSPLEPDSGGLKWDLLLLHTRMAGPFQEQVEYRTRERLEAFRTRAGNLIYDNGESFIISRVEGHAEGFVIEPV